MGGRGTHWGGGIDPIQLRGADGIKFGLRCGICCLLKKQMKMSRRGQRLWGGGGGYETLKQLRRTSSLGLERRNKRLLITPTCSCHPGGGRKEETKPTLIKV